MKVVGKAEPRVDGEEKVTGKALYTIDIDLPGMAHGKILRSPLPHAKVAKIDARKAERVPGVIATLTRDDLTGLNAYFGAAYKDQPIVAVDKVRYVGDPVAALVAEDEATAEEAIAFLEAVYEELPAVTNLDEALAPHA